MEQLPSNSSQNKPNRSSIIPIIPIVRNNHLPIVPKVRPLIISISKSCQPHHDQPSNFIKCIPEKEKIISKSQQTCLSQISTIREQPLSSHLHSTKMNPPKPNRDEPILQQAKKMERQYLLLFQQNIQLTKEFQLQRQQYDSIINNYQLIKKQNNSYGCYFFQDKKKRIRRTADQIPRDFQCPDTECGKSYGSEGSLMQHMRLKHNSMFKEMQKLIKQQKINHLQHDESIVSNCHFAENIQQSSNKKIHCQQQEQEVNQQEQNVLRPIHQFGKLNKQNILNSSFNEKKQIKEFQTGLHQKHGNNQANKNQNNFDQNKF